MSKVSQTDMVHLQLPDNEVWLAAFGTVTLQQEQLNHILRMTIKSLAGLEVTEALDATAYDNPSYLRKRIRKLAKKRLGEGVPLLKLQALITRSERVTNKRNSLVHGLCAKVLDGEFVIRDNDHNWKEIPKESELKELAAEIRTVMLELNEARLQGFLRDALQKPLDA